MKPIVVLTYPKLHRKTQDLCLQLKALGAKNIQLLALPFTYQKKFEALIHHRPSTTFALELDAFANNLDIDLQHVEHTDLHKRLSQIPAHSIVIGGIGIIPGPVVRDFTILNAHPALLPQNRGLDALKWAIYNETPVGVTTHIVDVEADAGWLIEQQRIDIHRFDTFHAVAQRLYELEIQLLAHAALNSWRKSDLTKIEVALNQPANKRMPNALEEELFSKFEIFKKKYGTS